jgi:anti-sigma factor RsiW
VTTPDDRRPPQDPPFGTLAEDALSAFIDGELDAPEQAAVEQRLSESAEWRSVLIEVREARDTIRALPMRDAPPGFWDGLLADGLLAGARPGDIGDLAAARRARRSRTARWVALAAGTAAAAIIGVAAVPGARTVQPRVAVLAGAHALRSSIGNDAVSSVAAATAGPIGP